MNVRLCAARAAALGAALCAAQQTPQPPAPCTPVAIDLISSGVRGCEHLSAAHADFGGISSAARASVCANCIPQLTQAIFGNCSDAWDVAVATLRERCVPTAAPTPAPTPAPPDRCNTVPGVMSTLRDSALVAPECSVLGETLAGVALSAARQDAICGSCLNLPTGAGKTIVRGWVNSCPPLRDAVAQACIGYGQGTPAPTTEDGSGSAAGSATGSSTSNVEIGGPLFNIVIGCVSFVVCLAWFLIWFNYIRKSKHGKQMEERLKNFNLLDVHPTRFGRKRESHRPSELAQDVIQENMVEGGLSSMFQGTSDGTSFAQGSRFDGTSRVDKRDMTIDDGAPTLMDPPPFADAAEQDPPYTPGERPTGEHAASGWRKVQKAVGGRTRAVVALRQAARARRQGTTNPESGSPGSPGASPRRFHPAMPPSALRNTRGSAALGRPPLEEPLLMSTAGRGPGAERRV